MNNKTLISVLAILVIGLAGFVVMRGASNNDVSSINSNIVATVYKSPTCGCCGVYASYMKKEGYTVKTENTQDMSSIKQKFNVPYELESCHTVEIDGYVVEGHVPEEAIQRLLTERPNIKGIGMPGMPSGSPGMPGPKTKDLVIYEITHEGTKGDIFMTI